VAESKRSTGDKQISVRKAVGYVSWIGSDNNSKHDVRGVDVDRQGIKEMMEIVTLTKQEVRELIEEAAREVMKQIQKQRTSPLMNKAQVAEYLDKSTATIDRYMREGMPYRKIDGGYPEFYKSEIDRWVNERSKEVSWQANHSQGQELV
jgi:predicted DNA-binding transcriptional regulator AlpA